MRTKEECKRDLSPSLMIDFVVRLALDCVTEKLIHQEGLHHDAHIDHEEWPVVCFETFMLVRSETLMQSLEPFDKNMRAFSASTLPLPLSVVVIPI